MNDRIGEIAFTQYDAEIKKRIRRRERAKSALELEDGEELFAGLLRDFFVRVSLVQLYGFLQAVKIHRAVWALCEVALDFPAFRRGNLCVEFLAYMIEDFRAMHGVFFHVAIYG